MARRRESRVKPVLVWLLLVIVFDGVACTGLQAMIEQSNKEDVVTPMSVSALRSASTGAKPLPTCQALFDPATTGGCARRGG